MLKKVREKYLKDGTSVIERQAQEEEVRERELIARQGKEAGA